MLILSRKISGQEEASPKSMGKRVPASEDESSFCVVDRYSWTA